MHTSQIVLHKRGVFGEGPTMAIVPQLAHVLGHPEALADAHGHGVAQRPGCCSSEAATVEGPHSPFLMFPWRL